MPWAPLDHSIIGVLLCADIETSGAAFLPVLGVFKIVVCDVYYQRQLHMESWVIE